MWRYGRQALAGPSTIEALAAAASVLILAEILDHWTLSSDNQLSDFGSPFAHSFTGLLIHNKRTRKVFEECVDTS